MVGPHALCGTELINLLLTGVARGNVGAYGAGGDKVSWRPAAGSVGMLSRDELESGMPLADGLKSRRRLQEAPPLAEAGAPWTAGRPVSPAD